MRVARRRHRLREAAIHSTATSKTIVMPRTVAQARREPATGSARTIDSCGGSIALGSRLACSSAPGGGVPSSPGSTRDRSDGDAPGVRAGSGAAAEPGTDPGAAGGSGGRTGAAGAGGGTGAGAAGGGATGGTGGTIGAAGVRLFVKLEDGRRVERGATGAVVERGAQRGAAGRGAGGRGADADGREAGRDAAGRDAGGRDAENGVRDGVMDGFGDGFRDSEGDGEGAWGSGRGLAGGVAVAVAEDEVAIDSVAALDAVVTVTTVGGADGPGVAGKRATRSRSARPDTSPSSHRSRPPRPLTRQLPGDGIHVAADPITASTPIPFAMPPSARTVTV